MAGEKIRVGVNGAGGRMGQRIVTLVHRDPELQVAAALEDAGFARLGADIGELAGLGSIGVRVQAELIEPVDVIIDFSVPAGAIKMATVCAARQIPLVAATTGLTADQRTQLLSAAQTTPLLVSPSMSAAVNLAMKLVREAARVLRAVPEGVDVEVVERHHRYKEDAPSGTALQFGRIVAEEMGQTEHVHGRHGRPGHRPPTEIGYHALRTGDNVGEHLIVFGLLGETLEVAVRGQSRDSYAAGALTAAKFLATRQPGMYSMVDALGL